MPKWKFLVVRHSGGAQQRRQICAVIKEHIERQGLASTLPLVKYEVSRGFEYYLGIAVDVNTKIDGCSAEDFARAVLRGAGITRATSPQYGWLIKPEEVGGLFRGNIECESFTIPIAYEQDDDYEAPATDQLFSMSDITELYPLDVSLTDSESYERLLQWCSATGTGNLQRMQTTCVTLGVSTDWGGAWSVLRRLVLLGHVEFDMRNAVRWGVIPPVFVMPAEEGEPCFLAGQRTPGLIQAIKSQVDITEEIQQDGPPIIRVHGIEGDSNITVRSGRQVACVGCVSARLSDLLPRLGDWASMIPVWDEQDFSRYQIKRYEPESNKFLNLSHPTQFKEGLYQFISEPSNRQQIVTVAFFDEQKNKFLCGDFYGLRFLTRQGVGVSRAFYVNSTKELLMPIADRWPMPYERALVLASGCLPRRLRTESGVTVISYTGITESLRERFSDLLGLEIVGELCMM